VFYKPVIEKLFAFDNSVVTSIPNLKLSLNLIIQVEMF